MATMIRFDKVRNNLLVLQIFSCFSIISSTYLIGDVSYNSWKCSTNVAFSEIPVRSRLECSSVCMKLDNCESIFYSATTGLCVGCELTMNTASNLQHMTGSVYYYKPSAAAPADVYVGCYYDTLPRAMSLHHLRDSASMTIEMCSEFCRQHGTLYFAPEFSRECFCDDSYDMYGPTTNCNMPCPGNTSQMCGGFNALSVYSFV